MACAKRPDLADPQFQRHYRVFDQAGHWDPDDPRLEELAERDRRGEAREAWTAGRDIVAGPVSTVLRSGKLSDPVAVRPS
jgi:hypothetical protein